MAQRLIDRMLDFVAKGKWLQGGHIVKVDTTSATALKTILRRARVYLYADDAIEAARELLTHGGYDLVLELLPRLRLPFDIIWIEPLAASEGSNEEDVDTIGYLLEAVPGISPTAFRITVVYFSFEDIGAMWMPYVAIFDPLRAIHQTLPQSLEARIMNWPELRTVMNDSGELDTYLSKILEQGRESKLKVVDEAPPDLYARMRMLMHLDVVPSPYQMRRGTLSVINEDESLLESISGDLVREARNVVALVLLRCLGGALSQSVEVTPFPAHQITKPFEEYLKHSVIKLGIIQKQIGPEIRKIMRGFGIHPRRHEVSGHWCVSRKKGNPECADIPRVCKPIPISPRRNQCAFCERVEWYRDNHGMPFMRGDAGLGFSIQTRIVTR